MVAIFSGGATIIAALIGLVAAFGVYGESDGGGGGSSVEAPSPQEVPINVAFSGDITGYHENVGGQTTVDIWVDSENVGELCTCRGVYAIKHELSKGSHSYRLEGTVSDGQYSVPVTGSGSLQAQDGRKFDISFGADNNGDSLPDEVELDPLS